MFFLFHTKLLYSSFFQQRKLGPGSYEIKDFLQMSDLKPRSTCGIVQTKDVRFKEDNQVITECSAFCSRPLLQFKNHVYLVEVQQVV